MPPMHSQCNGGLTNKFSVMTQKTQYKSTSFLLSNQVKKILASKGYTSIFNFTDYNFFKRQCAQAFNKAQAIADKFIDEADPRKNDHHDYIY